MFGRETIAMFGRGDQIACEPAALHGILPWARRISIAVAVGTSLTACLFLPVRGLSSTDGIAAEVLLERARAHRATLSADFAGFRSKLMVWTDGEAHQGRMIFRPPVTLEVEFGDADVRKVVKRTVRSLLSHRMATTRSRNRRDQTISYADKDSSYADKDSHPLGRRIYLGDKYSSSYRIRENRILEVNRNLEDSRLLITVTETESTPEGDYLPTHFFVVTFDKESGAVKQSSAYTDAYQEVGGEYLPQSRLVVRTAKGRTETLRIEWAEIDLLPLVQSD